VGWLGSDDDAAELAPPEPPAAVRTAERGGRWRITCAPTGEVAVPRTVPRAPGRERSVRARRSSVRPLRAGGEVDASSVWLPFKGRPPPRRGPQQIGHDTGTDHLDVQIHAYVWGARGADWRRVGKWEIVASDPFSVTGAVWSTAPTRCPWANSAEAAEAFGHNSSTNWAVAQEPSGQAGALVINRSGSHQLFLYEKGRSIIPVRDASKWEISHLSGAVKAGSTWFIGHGSAGGFRVFKIEADRIALLSHYSQPSGDQLGAGLASTLVRSLQGGSIGIWVRDARLRGAATRWFVFPVDPTTGQVHAPLVLPPERLAQLPPPCTEGDDGWLLVGAPPISPYLDLRGVDSVQPSGRITARLLASPQGLCVDFPAGQAESTLPARLRGTKAGLEAGRSTVPLALSDRERTGRRIGLRCTR
jgi:hypothetical protein